ncbi:MAG TPA: hypothetical protein VH879_04150 [Gemmatimonadales bacterium]|jgi:hypothetical protein
MSEDFYVGYDPKCPPGLTRFLRARVTALLVGCAAIAVVLATAARPLGSGNFAYGTVRDFEGRILEKPYPILAVMRPGRAVPAWSYYPLVGRGKHGADPEVAGLDGRMVHLKGTLIHRDASTMVELMARPAAAGEAVGGVDPVIDHGIVTVIGEIVDGKCHLGVMNPGEGQTHRACAVRCISGGAPPLLVTRDSTGGAMRYLLVDENDQPLGKRVLDLIAVPVRVTGRTWSRGDLAFLSAAPSTIERIR